MKCDSNNKDYDYKLDEEMTRFGTEITSLYDDYIDSNIHGKTR